MNPVVTSYVGTNSEIFPKALQLYSHSRDRILDMTWGLGVFWKHVDQSCYDIIRNDIDPTRGDVHHDFRYMPYPDSSFDVVILDPPYVSRGGKRGLKPSIDKCYGNHTQAFALGISNNKSTIQFYTNGMKEALRLLKPFGVLMVKCQDEIESGKQKRNHITIWEVALSMGFIDEDLFVLVQKTVPAMRHNYQLHARKNNSFLWVFRALS